MVYEISASLSSTGGERRRTRDERAPSVMGLAVHHDGRELNAAWQFGWLLFVLLCFRNWIPDYRETPYLTELTDPLEPVEHFQCLPE